MSSSGTSSTEAEAPARPPVSRRALLSAAGVALAVMVIGVISLLATGSPSTSSSSAAQVGQGVPAFKLPELAGAGTIGVPETGGGNGKAAVLIFFASWCGPCQKEMPALAAAVRDGVAGPAAVIGIDSADQMTSAIKFVNSSGVSFPVGFDSIGAVSNGKFGFPALPETVFVNAKGIITEIHYGAATPAMIRQGVRSLRP